jgi:hypothetical protein
VSTNDQINTDKINYHLLLRVVQADVPGKVGVLIVSQRQTKASKSGTER